MGKPASVISSIIKGKRPISLELAQGLSDAIGNSIHHWIKLETAYRLALKPKPDKAVARRAVIYGKYNVREMKRRGWIKGSDNIDELEAELCDLLAKNRIDDATSFKYAARKSDDYGNTTPEQEAWLARAWSLASGLPVESPYSEKQFDRMLKELALLKIEPEEIRHVPRVLSRYGIRFLIVEYLPRTKIDGACFWIDENSPVIALSLRFDRIDNFWFNLPHELAHIKYKDGNIVDNAIIGTDAIPTDQKPPKERRADKFATRFLVDQNRLDNFVHRYYPAFSLINIMAFAMNNEVHPGIIVGQLHHNGKMKYSYGRRFLVKIREHITATAVTDGFGHAVSI
jgi:HTH-type transcriptional regulator/antitoxin HigA